MRSGSFVICLFFALKLFLEAAESGQQDVRGVDMPYWAQFLPHDNWVFFGVARIFYVSDGAPSLLQL